MSPIPLPEPILTGSFSIEQALHGRRSTRQFSPEPLSLSQAGQLLWAAQGITSADGKRTAPSAGAICPLKVYLVVGRVDDLPPGVYQFCPKAHQITLIKPGDCRGPLAAASFSQSCISEGAAVIGFSATYEEMSAKYGVGSEKYVDMEVGHASQNVHLQAVSLGLGTVVVAAFREEEVRALLELPDNEKPLYFMPVGRPL